ncbi:NAD-dependent epimerase/dehydratase family protein [Streptomyces sp. NPDC055092]
MSGRTTVLVTGFAGFIGSHMCVEPLDHSHEVVVVDDHSNSLPGALERVTNSSVTRRPPSTRSTCSTVRALPGVRAARR